MKVWSNLLDAVRHANPHHYFVGTKISLPVDATGNPYEHFHRQIMVPQEPEKNSLADKTYLILHFVFLYPFYCTINFLLFKRFFIHAFRVLKALSTIN